MKRFLAIGSLIAVVGLVLLSVLATLTPTSSPHFTQKQWPNLIVHTHRGPRVEAPGSKGRVAGRSLPSVSSVKAQPSVPPRPPTPRTLTRLRGGFQEASNAGCLETSQGCAPLKVVHCSATTLPTRDGRCVPFRYTPPPVAPFVCRSFPANTSDLFFNVGEGAIYVIGTSLSQICAQRLDYTLPSTVAPLGSATPIFSKRIVKTSLNGLYGAWPVTDGGIVLRPL